jgi:hypothetical protein
MPTLPLYNHATHPDGWHQVVAPGGYEFWHFDAQDLEHDRVIVARLLCGNVFDPAYLHRYQRYLRQPTRVAPPLPREFLSAQLSVYHGGTVEHAFVTDHAGSHFVAATDRCDVRVGPNQIHNDDAFGAGALTVTMSGAASIAGQTLSARFVFQPRASRVAHDLGERELFAESSTSGQHRWIVGDAPCNVEGEIVLTGTNPAHTAFRGLGCHEHHYGTGPIGQELKRWFRGRVVVDGDGDGAGRCLAFHLAQPCDARAQDELHVVEMDGAASGEVEIDDVEADWSRRARLLLSYPNAVRFDDLLKLTRPRVIDSSSHALRLLYDAEYRGKRIAAPALCEALHPGRLRWPRFMAARRARW